MREKWIEAGLVTKDEMQTDCCYATQDKTWVKDPDGNEWEAFVVLKDNLPETAPCECGTKVTEDEATAATVERVASNESCCSEQPTVATEPRTKGANEQPDDITLVLARGR